MTDPFERFRTLHQEARARAAGDLEFVESMALATSTPDGAPSVRFVLFKSFDRQGLVFYTNYESRKARELDSNPRAAASLHWATTGVQVRIEGRAERLEASASDAYWASRPRESQIGGTLSRQSRPLVDREALLREVERMRGLPDVRFPRPSHWGGYRIVPELIEFWFAQPNRLHVRELFRRENGRWTMQTLYP
jgi:pyridoxamine 5'-phosphate oxidase